MNYQTVNTKAVITDALGDTDIAGYERYVDAVADALTAKVERAIESLTRSAARLGASAEQTQQALAQAGLLVEEQPEVTEEEQKVRSLVADASHYGVSESSVRQALVRAGFITA